VPYKKQAFSSAQEGVSVAVEILLTTPRQRVTLGEALEGSGRLRKA